MRYAEKFKESSVKNFYFSGLSLRQFAKRSGFNRATLTQWINKYGAPLNTVVPEKIILDKNNHNKEENWTPVQKLWAVNKYEGLPNEEKGIFLREHGLYRTHVLKWKTEMMKGLEIGLKSVKTQENFKNKIAQKNEIIELQKKTLKMLEEKEQK